MARDFAIVVAPPVKKTLEGKKGGSPLAGEAMCTRYGAGLAGAPLSWFRDV